MPQSTLRGRLIQGQGGSSLVEILVAMPAAVLIMALCLNALQNSGESQQRVEKRADVLATAQTGLERMTRELRQADWVHFSSSQIVDLDTRVRAAGSPASVHRHVRYDCSADACFRYEGAPVSFPPAPGIQLQLSDRLVPGLTGADVFDPRRTNPSTGAATPDYLNPDSLRIRVRVRAPGYHRPVELRDGVTLRNVTTFG